MGLKNVEYGFYSDEFRAFLHKANLEALDGARTATVDMIRQGLAAAEASLSNPMPDVTSRDYKLPTGVTARVFTAKKQVASGRRPLALIYHGGGWCVGGTDSEPPLVNVLVGKLGFVGVSIDYRLAPEHPFPTPLNDCYDGLKWAIANAAQLGADPGQVFVAGASAGANLATVVSMRARDEGLRNIRGQLLMCPATCHYRHFPDQYELESLRILNDIGILPAAQMKSLWDWYYPHQQPNPEVSPLLAKSLANLPPAYLQVAGSDVLRDEGIAYAEAMRKAGVSVKMDIYPGLPHCFFALQFGLESGKKSNADLEAAVKWIADQGPVASRL